MEAGDKMQTSLILKQFKHDDGRVNYPLVLRIPTSERITELAKVDFQRILMLVIGAITVAFENMNLKKGMNEMQILDLSEAIIDTSSEDNLSMEDLMLFLQKLVRGEYDGSLENMDIPKFMKIFEIYRQKRYEEYQEYKMNQHYQYKSLGDGNRSSKMDMLSERFSQMADKMSTLKRQISDLKEENSSLRMDNL